MEFCKKEGYMDTSLEKDSCSNKHGRSSETFYDDSHMFFAMIDIMPLLTTTNYNMRIKYYFLAVCLGRSRTREICMVLDLKGSVPNN